MYNTNQFRKGLKIEIGGEPFVITDFQHVKPGKGNAFTRTKMKSLISGLNQEKTFKSGEKVDKPDLEERSMEFLYKDELYNFMDLSTYEQIGIPEENLGDAPKYLKDNTEVSVLFFNDRAISIELPIFINFEIKQCDPGIRGDTVSSGSTKPATVETGTIVQVPLFVEEGEWIKIDTRTGDYVERVKAPK